ncbi:MAG: hypothetical protein M1835_006354 [Candelina submexicana]|nr:MAG: hypothetical protein M1835_006354 [Candelina submexicana]
MTMKQLESMSAYTAKFNQVRAKTEMNNAVLMHFFYHGLKKSVKDQLMLVKKLTTLIKLQDLVIKIDTRL